MNMLAFLWDEAFQKFRKNCTGAEFEELYKTFAPQGATPQAGDMTSLRPVKEAAPAVFASAGLVLPTAQKSR